MQRLNLKIKKSKQKKGQFAYKRLEDQLEEKKADLEEQKFAKEDLLDQTKESEQRFTTLVGNLKQQYRQIANEIASIEIEVRRKLEEQSKLKNLPGGSAGKLSWPTASRYITSSFHDLSYPYRHVFEHSGLDIRAAHGTALKAAASGYVGRAKHCASSSCYSYVMIIHADGISTVYGHMSSVSVKDNQFVARGDVIGYSGGTPGTVGAGPFVTGPHLHFEVRKNGIPVNPLQYLVKDY